MISLLPHAEDVYIAYVFTVYNTYDVSVTHVTSCVNLVSMSTMCLAVPKTLSLCSSHDMHTKVGSVTCFDHFVLFRFSLVFSQWLSDIQISMKTEEILKCV